MSHAPRIRTGFKSFPLTYTANVITLFTGDEFEREFGRPFDSDRDCVSVMNGSWKDRPVNVTGVLYNQDDRRSIQVFTDKTIQAGQWVRLCYMVALGA